MNVWCKNMNVYQVHTYIYMYITVLFIMHVIKNQSLITKSKMFTLSWLTMGNCGNCLQLGHYHLLDFDGIFNFRQER